MIVMAEKSEKKPKAVKEKPEKKDVKAPAKKEEALRIDDWGVIRFPHLSEKSIANIETQNRLVFIVKGSASKKEIKSAVERLFQVKVMKVNMLTTTKGEKKAFVRLDEKNSAADIATRLGMM